MTMPTLAPTKDDITSMNNADPDLPCRASGLPSRQVTAWEGVPGRLSRMQVMPPPYWAP
ncbi:hypothetical protein D3C81_2033980 [compost metagenome]